MVSDSPRPVYALSNRFMNRTMAPGLIGLVQPDLHVNAFSIRQERRAAFSVLGSSIQSEILGQRRTESAVHFEQAFERPAATS